MLSAMFTFRTTFPIKTKHFAILTFVELVTIAAALGRDQSPDMIKIFMCIIFAFGYWIEHITGFDFELRKFYILQCLLSLSTTESDDETGGKETVKVSVQA
ncbi:hypothetical protein HDU76_001164 [Blyttiomyces sp. JEL0837]|nr:hypothetical protein HDU76_001164 [Blyttiomyces sp. JEL0837]